jgi:hypothetical protein
MDIRALCAALLALAASGANGLELQFEEAAARMGVQFRLPEGAMLLPVIEPSEIDYQLAFGFPGAGYEVRCALTPVSELRAQGPQVDTNEHVPAFAVGLFASIAREDLCYSRVSELPVESVRPEFGADYGLTALLRGGKCAFSRGYAYVLVNVLYKKDAGLVLVYLLYNDPEDLRMEEPQFAAAYYCFRFGLTRPPPVR